MAKYHNRSHAGNVKVQTGEVSPRAVALARVYSHLLRRAEELDQPTMPTAEPGRDAVSVAEDSTTQGGDAAGQEGTE